MQKRTHTVRIYEYDEDIGMSQDENIYIWSFGNFQCLGTKNQPIEKLESYRLYQFLFDGLDCSWFDEKKYTEQKIDVFEYDYGIYCESDYKYSNYVIIDNIVWEMKEKMPVLEKDDEYIVLSSVDLYNRKIIINREKLEDNIESNNYTPVIRLIN